MNANQSNTTTTPNRNQLTDKELSYAKDFLSWELLAIKKCNDAAIRCQDTEIAKLIRDTGHKHQQQYQTILSFLQ
ncbi:hypothetical protein E0485_06285 [Paenibacillus albiflavus]|uniref:Spore coat protein n=1 Tax=Paenibacillus albiflavus TaxID=2545760 RepID=A0A4R4EH76_9BACL|nr:hypothetical protein [Paenibacillus albiflavus]TCZ79464.1 hypothetical protein E0485_06285 [Paenibacillus albiflavus]